MVVFQLHPITQTESEHKHLLSGYHVTRLMAALLDKTLSDDSPSSSFQNYAISRPTLIDVLL